MFEVLNSPIIDYAQWKSRLHGPAPTGKSNLYFTSKWPTGDTKWVSGQYLQIVDTVLVPYYLGYKLPSAGGDYKSLDLHNVTGSSTSLYPSGDGIVYETLIGMKPGAYSLSLFIPDAQHYLMALGYSEMYPNNPGIAATSFMSVFRPKDSPIESPLIKIWSIYNMAPWILRLTPDTGVDYEKPVLCFQVAKHKVKTVPSANGQAPFPSYTTIRYYDEQNGAW